MEKSNFEIGDLVRIKEGTHQDGMPESRVGLIIGVKYPFLISERTHSQVYEVQMGRSVLRFHQMFVEKLST